MTDWHEVTGPNDPNPVLVVRRGYDAEDHQTVTRPAALVFDHGDQAVIEGKPRHLARILYAAADLLTRPDHQRSACRSAAADPLAAHLAALRHLHHTRKRLARLMADTLTTQAPHAAYLVLGSADSSQDPDMLTADLLCDRDGTTIHTFAAAPLPGLPLGHPLRRIWQQHDLDPTRPDTYTDLMRALALTGGQFDEMPDRLLPPEAGDGGRLVLLLTRDAEPAVPELHHYAPTLVRPYRFRPPRS